jgi:hypothetical protein
VTTCRVNRDRWTIAEQPFHEVQSALDLMSKQIYSRKLRRAQQKWQSMNICKLEGTYNMRKKRAEIRHIS